MRTLQSQMTGMRRVQYILAGVALVAAVGVYAMGIRPVSRRLADLEAQRVQRQEMLDQSESRASNLPKVALEVDRLRMKLERFDKRLPRQQELGPFIREITQLSQQSQLRKLTLQPSVPRTSDLYAELPISMNFEGDFMSVFAFLKQTEEMQRLTRVKNIIIRNKDAKLGQVEVQMSMNIYFSEG
jgi:Tfp pilus assembly protein PilO